MCAVVQSIAKDNIFSPCPYQLSPTPPFLFSKPLPNFLQTPPPLLSILLPGDQLSPIYLFSPLPSSSPTHPPSTHSQQHPPPCVSLVATTKLASLGSVLGSGPRYHARRPSMYLLLVSRSSAARPLHLSFLCATHLSVFLAPVRDAMQMLPAMGVAAQSPHLNHSLHVHGYTWHLIALSVHLLALFLLYITYVCVLARHCRTSTLAANLERSAYILHCNFNFTVAHHTCQQHMST